MPSSQQKEIAEESKAEQQLLSGCDVSKAEDEVSGASRSDRHYGPKSLPSKNEESKICMFTLDRICKVPIAIQNVLEFTTHPNTPWKNQSFTRDSQLLTL